MYWCSTTLIRSPVYLGLCLSEKQFAKQMKRMNVKNPPEFFQTPQSRATVHFFDQDGGKTAIVCFRKYKKKHPVEVLGLLVHEAVHIWQNIAEYIGEDAPSKEFEAYAIQNLSQQLILAYRKLTK